MKKIALVMSLVMMIFTFSGFTTAEKAYLDETMKLYEWDAIESQQDISFELTVPGEIAVSYDMDISSEASMEDFTTYIEIDTQAHGLSPKIPAIKMYTKGADMYINTEAFVAFAKMAGIESDKLAFTEEYVMLKSEQQVEVNQNMIKELYAFIEQLDPGVDTGLVQDGNEFTLEMDSDKMVDLLDAYIVAVIENIDKLPEALMQGQPTVSEQDKQQALEMYTAFVAPYKQIIKDAIKGSTYSEVTVFEEDKYTQTASFELKTPQGDAKLEMDSVSNRKDEADITLPTSVKILTQDDFNELVMPDQTSKSASVSLDGSYVMYDVNGMSSGMIGIKNINGETYLKTADLSTAFGRIFDTNEEFIRTTMLESYGFDVQWNSSDRTIEIQQ